MTQAKTRSHMSLFIQVMIACVIVNLANGSNYVWSVYSSELMSTGGWTATMATLPYTLNVVTSSFASLLGGTITEKFQPRVTVFINGILYFLGWYICGSTNNPWVIILCFGLLAGAAQGMNPNAATSTASKWAPKHLRGLASGISHSANGFSSMYMAPLGASLLAIGLSNAFHTMGVVALVICWVGGVFLLKPRPELMEAPVKVEAGQKVASNELSFKDALRTKSLWLLFAINGIALIGGGIVFSQCANIAKTQAGWNGGYILVMILALSNGGGRILYNSLSDKIGIYKTFYIMFALSAIGMVLLLFATSVPMLIVCIVLVGSAFGGTNAIIYPAVTYEFGTNSVAKLQAVVAIAYLFQGLCGATIAGIAYDVNGDYSVAYIIGAVCMVVAIGLAVAMKKEHARRLPDFN